MTKFKYGLKFVHWALLLGTGFAIAVADAAAATKVGVTAAVNPAATGRPPRSKERVLKVGVDMQANERVRTGATGRVQLLFQDGSAMTIGPNSDLVIDEFVYDPKRPEKLGKLAFSVTKGLFRFVGGRISKRSTVTIKTPSATLGIRGGVAIINATTGKYILLFGCMDTGRTSFCRPGFAVDRLPDGSLSAPRPTTPAEIKKAQAGFEAPPAVGLAKIAPAGGGQSGGGQQQGSIDGRVAASGISQGNSGTPPGPPQQPAAPTITPTGGQVGATETNVVADSTAATTNTPTEQPPPPADQPPPPADQPPPPGQFVGRLVRAPAFTDYDNFTTLTTRHPANDLPFVSALPSGDRLMVTMPNGEVFEFPYTPASTFPITTANSTGPIANFVGIGFVAADQTYFRYFGGPPDQSPNFVVFGGVPTANFPTSGFATHTMVTMGIPGVSDLIPFAAGSAGVSISPGYSAYSTNLGTAANLSTGPFPAARSVWLQASLGIVGQGASQASFLIVQTGVYGRWEIVNSNVTDVALASVLRGTYRANGSDLSTRYFSFFASANTGTGNAIYGPQADYMVLVPDLVGVLNPPRRSAAGFVQPFTNLPGDSYYAVQSAEKTATPAGLGATRTTRTLYGYSGGLALIREGPNEFKTISFAGATGGPEDVMIQTNAATNRIAATFNLIDLDGDDPNGDGTAVIRFGSLTGNSGARTAFIDDRIFAAQGNTHLAVTDSSVGGVPVAARVVMVTQAVVPTSGFLPTGVSFCKCEYLQWGYWGGELTFPTTGPDALERDRIHISTWVAGVLPGIEEFTTLTGTATYNGHIIGNVLNGSSRYIAAGGFQHTWNFASRAGNVTISQFDGKNFAGSATSLNGRDLTGSFSNGTGITGTYNGSFFKGGGDPAKAMGGSFKMGGTNYKAAGTFAASK